MKFQFNSAQWWLRFAFTVFVFLSLFLPAHAKAANEETENPQPIVYYDASSLLSLDLHDPTQLRRLYDESHLLASLQGLVNRKAPRLFIRYHTAPDDFWWQRMTEPGGWLQGREVKTLTGLTDLLKHFQSDYNGVVVWDERVPATSNVASTIAGCDNLLCLRYDESESSLSHRLTVSEMQLPVQVRLFQENRDPLFTGTGTISGLDIPTTGSAKADAYVWQIDRYVKTGKTNPACLGYYIDAFWLKCWQASSPTLHTLMNHDYVIARGGAFFDLHVWDDEAPVDDPHQKPGTDAAVLRQLLRACYDRTRGQKMIHAAGFTPWAFKYTDFKTNSWNAGGRYGGVPTEWKYAEILSCFNAFMDADAIGPAAMSNASFFQHLPIPDRVPQNEKPTIETLQDRGYIDSEGKIVPQNYFAHYVGDYDSAAWLYWMMPSIWTDAKRGQLPLSWAFNPNLSDRFPVGMLWTRQTRTPNDWFVAGDSGAGYINPGLLSEPRPHSGLPSGWPAWEKHCQDYYTRWDISLTGFVIDGNAPGLKPEGLDAYARFSPHGIVPQKIPLTGIHNQMPFIRMTWDLPDNSKQAARVIADKFIEGKPQFQVYRSILKTPTWYVNVQTELEQLTEKPMAVVDLYTLLQLVKYSETAQ